MTIVEDVAVPMAGRVSDAIRETRACYHADGHSDWDIGNGLCEDFATDVLHLLLGDRWVYLEGKEGNPGMVETLNFVGPDEEWDWPLLEKITGIQHDDDFKRRAAQAAHDGHIWIMFDGKHYDAERPNGVRDIFELPFFSRKIEPHSGRN